MKRTRIPAIAIATALLIGAGGSAALAPAAQAVVCATGTGTSELVRPGTTTPTKKCCVRQSQIRILSAKNTRIPFDGVKSFRTGPGGTMSTSKAYSGTASYSVVLGSRSDVDAVLAKAKQSVSKSLRRSNSTKKTEGFEYEITKGKFGNAKYVSYGKTVTWEKYRVNANCSTTRITTGKIRFPAKSEGWYYWETKS